MITKYKSISLLILVLLFIHEILQVTSLRISSRKCEFGHYYNDGCVSCWCEKNTGESVCEHMTSCPRTAVKCPMGRKYRDECDNECTCYETTGAIFCKEKGPCNAIRRRNIFESVKGPSSLDQDFHVPDPVYLPKDDIIIEPALIIRRKSFKGRKDEESDHFYKSSTQLGSHKSRKAERDNLLYLYQKQLKSMNEFRHYYKKYLENEKEEKETEIISSSNYETIVRKPFINLNIPNKYPPRPSGPKGPPSVPKGPPNYQPPPPRPPPTSTIVYEQRFTFPVTRKPFNYNNPSRRPLLPNLFRVPAPSSVVPLKVTPRPFTLPPSTTIVHKAKEEYSGSTYPNNIKGLPQITQKVIENHSRFQMSRPLTPNHFLTYNHPGVIQPVSNYKAPVAPSTPRPVLATAPSVRQNYYSSTPNPLQHSTTRRPVVSVTPKSMTQRPTPPHRFPYHTEPTIAPNYYSTMTTIPYRRPYQTTRRPTQATFRTTPRPFLPPSSTRRPTFPPSPPPHLSNKNYYSPPRHWHPQNSLRRNENPFDPNMTPVLPYNAPFVHAEMNKPIRLSPFVGSQFGGYKPRPKQYQIFLKTEDRKPFYYSDNNRVPHFVDKIAREFFRKPEIYIPKMKNGQPGLERVVFNHKEIIPKELILEPGGRPVKINFSPQAEEQMAKEWSGHFGQPLGQPLGQHDIGQGHQIYPQHSRIPYGNSYPENGNGDSQYQSPPSMDDYRKHYPVAEYDAPVSEPDPPKSDYYDAQPIEEPPMPEYEMPSNDYSDKPIEPEAPKIDYYDPPQSEQNTRISTPDSEGHSPFHVVNHHYEIPSPNPDYPTPLEYPHNNNPLPSDEFEYLPQSLTQAPAFQIPTDQLDNFNEHNKETMIFESILKSHEVPQTSETLEPENIQDVLIQHRQSPTLPQMTSTPTSTPRPLTFSLGSSSEINHDEIIRSILAMDPEIGPDAIIYKSNGETLPPNPVTLKTPSHPLVAPKPKDSLKVNKVPQIKLRADSGIITFDMKESVTEESRIMSTTEVAPLSSTTESEFDKYFRELFSFKDVGKGGKKADGIVETEGVAKIFSYDLQKSTQVFESSSLTDREKRNDGKLENKTLTSQSIKSTTTMRPSSTTIESREEGSEGTTMKPSEVEDPSSSFKKELDWKSDLMSNICSVNPNSPLCFTYKSLCLLMTT